VVETRIERVTSPFSGERSYRLSYSTEMRSSSIELLPGPDDGFLRNAYASPSPVLKLAGRTWLPASPAVAIEVTLLRLLPSWIGLILPIRVAVHHTPLAAPR
jgi:hypothetical protein